MALEITPGLTYLTRGEWGARTNLPALGHPVSRGQRTHIIIHHTVIIDNDATANLWETVDEVKAKMVQLQTIRPDLGLDVPYNFVIFLMADGSIMVCEGRGIALTGAHTHSHNTDGIGTALQGNFQLAVNVSPYIPLISRFLGWLKYDQGLGSLRAIDGHSDFSSTACPGENLYIILGQLTYAREDDMALTTEEHDWLSTIHHFSKLSGPMALASIISKVNHNHHHLHVVLPALIVSEIAKIPGGSSLTEAQLEAAVLRALEAANPKLHG